MGGEFRSSLLQQMAWSSSSSSGGTDSKNMMSSSLMPCAEEQEEEGSNKMPPLSSPSTLLPQHPLQIFSGLPLPLPPEVLNDSSATTDLHDGRESSMPESWSQLLLGGLVGDHERYNAATALLSKGLEEGPGAYNCYGHGHGGEEIQASGANSKSHQVSQTLLASSSPRSCITTSFGSNMLDFSNTVPAPELKNHHSDNSSESAASGSEPKKARVQTSSSAQSTLKETIGYIRFLLGQIEALSFPYLDHDNGNSMQQHNNLLLDHSTSNGMVEVEGPPMTNQEGAVHGIEEGSRKDLRSRGLCLVPVSCTSHLADDNGPSDFWAVSAAPPPPPPPFAGIIWR